MKLIIDRKTWLRGEGSEDSRLLRGSDGKMCCLGFYGLACGLEPKEIKGMEAPFNLPEESLKKVSPWLLLRADRGGAREPSSACSTLMTTNDREVHVGNSFSDPFTEQDREESIKRTFALNGVEVEFIN